MGSSQWLVLALVAVSMPPCLLTELPDDLTWSCPPGWTGYSDDKPNTCLKMSSSETTSMVNAHDACKQENASLIMVNSRKKYLYFLELLKSRPSDKFWMGMMKVQGSIKWKNQHGSLPASNLPKELNYDSWFSDVYYRENYGLLFNSGGSYLSKPSTYHTNRAHYICERRPDCNSGYFGLSCDIRCHCHGQACDPKDTIGFCPHGCEVGWMGKSCSKVKEAASVKYYCVKSADEGQYLHVRIYTKGVDYDRIGAVDDGGNFIDWCNNTEVKNNERFGVQTLKINIDQHAIDEMKRGSCAGTVKNESYTWKIRVQERKGFVSKNDQVMSLTCDQFTEYETLAVSSSSDIEVNDIQVEKLTPQVEGVELSVVDAFTGQPVKSAPVSTSVVLRIRYGLEAGDASGVKPYNCEAATPTGDHRVQLTDAFGCELKGSIISHFKRNDSQSLITKPFPLIRLPGAKEIKFHCSFSLCYDNSPCPAGCRRDYVHRSRRSSRITERSLSSSVVVEMGPINT